MEWIFIVGGFAIGIIGGYFLGHSANDSTGISKEVEAELQGVQEELQHYRQEVTHHFSRTAELFNTMTSDYRNLYQHLAEGAQKFCATDAQLPDAMAKLEPLAAQDEVATAVQATGAESAGAEAATVVEESTERGEKERVAEMLSPVGESTEKKAASAAPEAAADIAGSEPGSPEETPAVAVPAGNDGEEPVAVAGQQEKAGSDTAPSIERLQDSATKKPEQSSFTVAGSGENEQRLH